MAGIGDLITKLMGIGPTTPDAVEAAAYSPAPPGGPAGAPAYAPATTIAAPTPAPTGGAAPGGAGIPGAPGGPATPPDLSALYDKLIQDRRSEQYTNTGLGLMASAFARPEDKAGILGSMVNLNNASGDPASSLQTLISLRNDAIKQQQLVTGRAQLQGIADRYKLPLPVVQQMYEAGKLPEFLQGMEKPSILSSDKLGISAVVPGTGKVTSLQEGVDDTTTAQKKLDFARDNWQKYMLPDPNNPSNQNFWQNLSTKVLAPGGQQINVGENAFNKFTAEKVYGAAVQEGQAALGMNHVLDSMKALATTADADKLPSGPAALIDMKARQGLASALGVEIGGLPEAEGIAKLNQQLATLAVKAISSRPTQMEFAKALENNPGLLQSRAGMIMMMEILKQDNAVKAKIGGMALDTSNHGKDWLNMVDRTYASNPLMSPLDKSRPLGKEDLEIFNDPNRFKVVEGKSYFEKGGKWFQADM